MPASRGITDQDVDKLLIEDFGIVGRKQRIYALYQQGLSDEQIADHLRGEYNRHGVTAEERAHEGPCVLADGGNGYGYFVAAEWRLRRRDVDGPMRSIKYKEMAAHIRALIDEGRYLTPDELKKYESDRLGMCRNRERKRLHQYPSRFRWLLPRPILMNSSTLKRRLPLKICEFMTCSSRI